MSALWETIDLDRHGIIEAHAGTGKTYTIVKVVLTILQREITDETGKSRLIHIRELLLVTFTEKAAGELKNRIREELKEKIASLPPRDPLSDHLKNCLNTLHEALIGTIHSVCLRLLRTWPFESGVHFETEIVDDLEGLKSALRESMRTDWQEEGRAIPWALQRMAETGAMPDEKQFALIRKTAKELLDEEFTALDRIVVGERTLPDLRLEYEKIGKRKSAHRNNFDTLLEQHCKALEEMKKSGKLAPDKEELCRIRIDDLREMIRTGSYRLKVLQKPVNFGATKIFVQKEIGNIPGTSTAVECIDRIANHPLLPVLQQEEEILNTIPLALICDAAECAARRWIGKKRAGGLLSFQDMLRLMHRAVTEHPAFSASLRKKIRYAVIDEFQDTSRLQWEVFQNLFIGEKGSKTTRLYIVGDPKQSIYAFRGADVNSYLDARNIITRSGGKWYPLESNFRSLGETVAGYNAVFVSDDIEENWFLFNDDAAGIQYPSHRAVLTPERDTKPTHPLKFPPFQIMALGGTKPKRTEKLAQDTALVIQRLVGMPLSVPDGAGWKNSDLGYNDFAVIVESHKDAQPFLDEFRKNRIPAVKYRMEGVFQSPMARALHALIRALLAPSGKPAPRLAALLTPFFNRKPEALDPDHDLEPCENPACNGDTLCMAHALEEWTGLAARSLWAQLFESIQRLTGIRERLLHLIDGERHCADLRQVIDYCMECLYRNNYTLASLAEHLKSLLHEETVAGEDRNLHVLETEKSSVRVLTMHASKGLEFPVVFVVTGGSKAARKGPSFIRYTCIGDDTDAKTPLISIAPYITVNDIRVVKNALTPEDLYINQAHQERRRLLYVALTRAQALLFVPMHLNELPEKTGRFRWNSLKEGANYDRDLTPKLLELLDTADPDGPIALFDEDTLPQDKTETTSDDHTTLAVKAIDDIPDIASLNLPSRICRQTSYSQLSRETSTAREIDKSEEGDTLDMEDTDMTPSALPGGKDTGDALHCAIEELLGAENAQSVVSDDAALVSIVEKYLTRNGVLSHTARADDPDAAIRNAVSAAVNCVRGALTSTLPLPGGGVIKGVASIARTNLIPEMEFLLQVDRHWVHGFMDLVFRIRTDANVGHPWRYFVLDWKSDTLASYTLSTIAACMEQRHYSLQAKLYCHALDKYLSGVLGSRYDPGMHLGGAVYLFLREHERLPLQKASVWSRIASSAEDAAYSSSLISARHA